LPGRAATVAVLVGLAVGASLYRLWRTWGTRPRTAPGAPLAVIVVVAAAASLPFVFNERQGPLGEGIYTNDQGAQLYWTDWLQNGFGPEPKAVQLGYPTGPQAVAATAAESTKAPLLDAFNGLLLAIAVLTALTALAALEALPTGRRVVAASLAGLPYLGASFLAQSAFKETAMALLVLAFAVALSELGRERPPGDRQLHSRRAMLVALVLFTVASVFVYSLPGLVWFALAVPIWLALELGTGRMRIDMARLREEARRHRRAIVAATVIVVAVAALSAAQLSGFVGKVGAIQESAGRLNSPVFPGEALGIWPEGDFQIVRGEVEGAYLAVALGLLAAAVGALAAVRRRDFGLVAVGAAAVLVYAGARAFASIYVEAKALAVIAPLVVVAALGALLAPQLSGTAAAMPGSRGSALTAPRYVLGAIVAVALAGSSFLALRAAPVGFDQRGDELEGLAGLVRGHTVAFLGVDRFAGYWLRGTLTRSPGGYVPAEVRARPKKVWRKGTAMDLDTLAPRRLDEFEYAITTRAAYQSTPPPNFATVVTTPSYVLWRRSGPTPPLRVIESSGRPGRVLDCTSERGRRLAGRTGAATVVRDPVVGGPGEWSVGSPFDAPEQAAQSLDLGPGRWRLSLQYHSQAPLTVSAAGSNVELPPSLDGMYLTEQGQGAFWPAGEVRVRERAPLRVTVDAARPSRRQRDLGVQRRVWLGRLAASRPGGERIALRDACGQYVDHYTVRAGQPSRSN
ncbi:MAG TPA: hypothetical protein VLA62_07170, partial [Solirubrobacterales bacterium]|nr:hypothetical protein [Solirubrobacterales bacterium]